MYLSSNANLVATVKTLPRDQYSYKQAEKIMNSLTVNSFYPNLKHYEKIIMYTRNRNNNLTLCGDLINHNWCIITETTLSVVKAWIFAHLPTQEPKFAICLHHHETGIPVCDTENWFKKIENNNVVTQKEPYLMTEEETKNAIKWLDENFLPKVFPGTTHIRIGIHLDNIHENWPFFLDGLSEQQFFS